MAEAVQKTVIFNAGAPTPAMSSGVRLAVYGSGIPAAILLTYSGIATIGLAVGLSPTVPDAIVAALVAGAMSVAVGALPILAGILEKDEKAQLKAKNARNGDAKRSRFSPARIGWYCFYVCLFFSALAVAAHFDYTRQTNFASAPGKAATVPYIDPRRINTFRAKEFRIRTDENHYAIVTGDELLKQTSNCQTFEYDDERGRCEDLAYPYSEQQVHILLWRSPSGPAAAGGLRDFVPEWAIPWLLTGNVAFLHLSALLLGVGLAIVCAGSYAVLTRGAPTPDSPLPVVGPIDVKTTPDDYTFKLWWRDCVTLDRNVKGTKFKDIFQNYEDYCWPNFDVAPLGKKAFGEKLAAHVTSMTEGKASRHANGTVYDGISLAS